MGRTDIEILGIRVLGRSLFSRRFSLLFHGLGIHGLERTLEQFSRHVCFRQNFTRHELGKHLSLCSRFQDFQGNLENLPNERNTITGYIYSPSMQDFIQSQ